MPFAYVDLAYPPLNSYLKNTKKENVMNIINKNSKNK